MGSARLTEETIAAICTKVGEGLTMAMIGNQVGLTRNAVTGIVFRLRQAGDPGIAPAGPRITVTAAQQRDAIADAFAAGSTTLQTAAAVAGVAPNIAITRWNEVCQLLGSQAA